MSTIYGFQDNKIRVPVVDYTTYSEHISTQNDVNGAYDERIKANRNDIVTIIGTSLPAINNNLTIHDKKCPYTKFEILKNLKLENGRASVITNLSDYVSEANAVATVVINSTSGDHFMIPYILSAQTSNFIFGIRDITNPTYTGTIDTIYVTYIIHASTNDPVETRTYGGS